MQLRLIPPLLVLVFGFSALHLSNFMALSFTPSSSRLHVTQAITTLQSNNIHSTPKDHDLSRLRLRSRQQQHERQRSHPLFMSMHANGFNVNEWANVNTNTHTNMPHVTSKNMHNHSPGKIVAERHLYRFSPSSSSVQTPFTIEERQYFSVKYDKTMEPLPGKTYIFRQNEEFKEDGISGRLYTKIGSPIFTLNGFKGNGVQQQQKHEEQLSNSDLAIALFCMQHPEIIGGKGLQLGSGDGLGGILSVIGAGLVSSHNHNPHTSPTAPTPTTQQSPVLEDAPHTAPLPIALSQLLLTDSNEQNLHKCLDNLEAASFDVSKVNLRLKKERNSNFVQNDLRNEFNFVLSRNTLADSSDVERVGKNLAKNIAYSLQSSSYDEFLHVEPQRQVDKDVIATLIDELESGYRMNTMRKEIVMEKIHLTPLELDSLENVESQMRDEIDQNPGSFVEYQKMSMERYSALVGCHSDAFNGLNGEEFFPASHVELATSLEEQNLTNDEDSEQTHESQVPIEVVFADGDEGRVRSIYQNWCNVYRRESDPVRFYTFAFNFLEMEAYCRESGSKLQFHKFMDCTEEESFSLSTGKSRELTEADDELRFAAKADMRLREIAASIERKERATAEARMQREAEERENAERVHSVYLEWCEVYGKEMNEDRFGTFLFNFLAMEAHAAETGKTMVLNQWYDCTEEEHKIALEAEAKEKAEEEARVAAKAAALEKAEEEKKKAASAQLKIREKALEHRAKAIEQRRIAGEHWKKAEEQAKLAAQVEADAKAEDRMIAAADSTVEMKALEEAKVVQEKRLNLRESAAQIQHRAIVASRHHMRTAETERMARIQEIYIEWCDVFGKEIHEARFYNFASNFLVMEATCKETGETLELNQWYDFSEEEFTKHTTPEPHPSLSSIVEFVEEDPEEAVMPEVYEADAAVRQAWYHCTDEEYEALTSGRATVKIQMAEETIKEALDVNFIESDATQPLLTEGMPPVQPQAHSQTNVHQYELR